MKNMSGRSGCLQKHGQSEVFAEALLEKEVLDGSDIDQILMQSTSQAVPA
jgi:hypothetical protein